MADGTGSLSVFLVEDEPSLMYVLEESLKSLGYAVGRRRSICLKRWSERKAKPSTWRCWMSTCTAKSPSRRRCADGARDPFVFTTGFGARTLPERFQRTPVMEKPFRLKDIRRAISELHPAASV